MNHFSSARSGFNNKIIIPAKRGVGYVPVLIRRRPIFSFLGSLLLLFLLIYLGNTVFKTPVKETPKIESIKDVQVLTVGKAPQVQVQAEVIKDGVVVISAQTPGVVSEINVTEGDEVNKGKVLVSLASNYQGGNAASLQTALASKQYRNIVDTFATQKEIIQKQKEIAQETANNTEEMRTISANALSDTRNLLSLNDDILSGINKNLDQLTQNNPEGVNDATILQTKQLKAQIQVGTNTLRTQLQNAEYATDTSNPPTKLANLTKEMTLKQLEVQEKALILSKEVAALQVSLAAVNEAMMFPSAPCQASIQKIHVAEGQLVSPGQPLVTLYTPSGNTTVEARVTQNVATSLNKLEPSYLRIDDEDVEGFPEFISTQATNGQLYSVIYQIPEYLQQNLTDGEFITVTVPVGAASDSKVSFIPLDAVNQTNSGAFIYVVKGDVAESKKVTLGEVLGSDVEVLEGLSKGDEIILNRNVISGDKVKKI